LSVTAEKLPVEVPPVRETATVRPPEGSWFPAASFAVIVTVTPDPEATVPAETETVDWARDTPPAVTVTDGAAEVTLEPPIVAWIAVAVPVETPVKDAVYVPLPTSVVPPKVPVELPPKFVKATVSPPEGSAFPAASFAVSVAVMLEPEATVPAETVTSDWASETAPGVTVTVGSVEVIAEPPIVAFTVVAVPEVVPVKREV
jgi:hypothetical protein